MKKIFYCMIFVILACVFSSLFPYPILSSHTNITEANAYQINNYFETEMQAHFNQTPQILDFSFNDINVLLPVGEELEIIDIKTEQTFYGTRTGGNNHIDLEIPISDMAGIKEICEEFSWQRRPVLVKLNSQAYLPASLSLYPHGYATMENSIGHFCLHFKDSKTDGTKETDLQHQKAVSYAKKHGIALIKE